MRDNSVKKNSNKTNQQTNMQTHTRTHTAKQTHNLGNGKYFSLLSVVFFKDKDNNNNNNGREKNFPQVTSRHFGSFVIISGSFEFELGLYERWTKYTQRFTVMKNAKQQK